jgi:hypothetical protein
MSIRVHCRTRGSTTAERGRVLRRLDRRRVRPAAIDDADLPPTMPHAAFVGALPVAGARLRGARLHRDASLAGAAPRRTPAVAPTASLGAPLRLAAAAAAAAAALAVGGARPAHALFGIGRRERAPVITMTNLVPTTFSLPSEGGADGGPAVGLVGGAVGIVVKRVLPGLGAVALAVVAVRKVLERAQEKQLRDFQSQLQSFSSMLDLDGVGDGGKGAGVQLSGAEMAKKILNEGSTKYKFRDAAVESESEKIAAKVRLDLFQKGGGSGGAHGGRSDTGGLAADMDATGTTGATGAEPAAASSPEAAAVATAAAAAARAAALASIRAVAAETSYEKAVAAALNAVETSGEAAAVAAAPLDAARVASGLSVDDAKLAFNTFVSRVVSVQIDKAAVTLGIDAGAARTMPTEEDAVEGLRHLSGLATTMRAAADVASESGLVTGLAYVGARAVDEKAREELYRAYAVFCLSDETRVKDDSALQGLLDMQMLLSLSDERAEAVNKEIAKGMFQVAVSSAMADGSMTTESRDALEQLKGSFGDFLDGGSADNIISEVSVMRAMYSLQQLLAEQGVSEEDVTELRKMCADLGVDVDEMMRNADQMGDALGPEAQQFVGGLRALLQDGDAAGVADGIGSLMANAGLDLSAADAEAGRSPGGLGGAGPAGAGDGPLEPGAESG